MRRVIVESPYAGAVERNIRYLRAAMRDCLSRGEAPFASHGLYTQPGVLEDGNPDERALGINAGFAWRDVADATVVYEDIGVTPGMQAGIDDAVAKGRLVERRRIGYADLKATRPSWDEYFVGVAGVVSTRATCDRAHVGAVMVRDRRILSTGYNGSPPGVPHCDDVGHVMQDGHCVATSHAEANAIASAARAGVRLEGATCYVTHAPCFGCRKALASAGVVRVVYRDARGEPPPDGWAGIRFERF